MLIGWFIGEYLKFSIYNASDSLSTFYSVQHKKWQELSRILGSFIKFDMMDYFTC